MKKSFILLPMITSFLMNANVGWEGQHYQKTSRPQYEMAEYAISLLPQQEYKTILDIGCGSGEFTIKLCKNTDYVLGVDYSSSMIEQAQQSYSEYSHVDFQVGDIRDLSSIKQQFDLVTAFHPIQWIPALDQQKAFEQLAQHIKPGGTCLVLVSDRHNIFYEPIMKIAYSEKWNSYFPVKLEPWNWQTRASIATSFEHVQLRPLNIMVWSKHYYLHSKQEFSDFMANWLYNAKHFNYLPEEKRVEFFNDVLEYFLISIGYAGNGPIEFESPFVIGIAQKL